MLTETEKALIVQDAKANRYFDVEIADEEFTLKDGRTAYLVKVFTEVDEDGYLERVLDESECYYATIVDGIVYGNEELEALRWEYATADEIHDAFDAFLAAS